MTTAVAASGLREKRTSLGRAFSGVQLKVALGRACDSASATFPPARDTAGAMSQENVEIVSRALDALNRDGIEAVLEFLDPDVEWTTTGLFVEAGTYRGHDGVLRYFGAMANDLEFHIEPEKFIDGGDQVVIPTRIAVRGKRSGATSEATMTVVCSIQDGRIARLRNYFERTEALEAAGLSE
jgi:uncharacterized protein